MEATGSFASNPSHDADALISWKIQGIGGIGFLLLMLFTWIPNSYSYMVGWPYILIWQSAFLVIGGYTVWLCRKFSIPFSRLGHGLDYIVALVSIVTILSTATAQFRAVACWNLLLIVNYTVCLYFLVNWLRHGFLTRYLLWATLSVTGLITSIIGLSLWRPSSSMWLSESFSTAIRNAQPLGHHNFVGGYELLLLPVVLSFSLAQTGWRKWIGITASTIVVIALYVSGSRGALMGLLALGLITLVLGLKISKGKSRQRWLAAGLCFCLMMSIALVSNPRFRTLLSFDKPVGQNTPSFVALTDGPTKDRVFMLSSTRNILKENPFLGVGPGNLSRVYNRYRPIEAGTGLALVQQVHNTPAQLAAELGLFGLAIYISLLTTLIKLSVSLHQRITKNSDRFLLYGIVGSWVGYGISSLSDYQLENIGISSTLVTLTALLISLADKYKPHTRKLELSNRLRRGISMGLLVLLCANFQLWLRVDTGLYLSDLAIREAQVSNFLGADEKWSKAGSLVPWDPTYSALAAETMLDLMTGLEDEKDIQALRQIAIEYFLQSVQAAPNDPWFNQNVAALLIDQGEAAAAEPYARKATLLSPRNSNNYTYYTLGLSLLNQDRNSEAIEAFALEALANPIFLTTKIWEQPPFLPLKNSVISKTLKYYQEILSETNKASKQYQWLHEQWAMLSWWHDYPLSEQEKGHTRPLVQAILISHENPREALQLIEKHINGGKRLNDLHLLQARLSPETYLPELLNKLDGIEEEKEILRESVEEEQSMQDWFGEVSATAKSQVRQSNIFTYRNLGANSIRKILYPGTILKNVLPSSIGLFPDAPREYPQLERFMADIRDDKLSINWESTRSK